MLVETAYLGALGADSDTKIGATEALRLKAAGLRFLVRYLSLGANESGSDLDKNEVTDILGAGLALMAVQHVRLPGWTPSAAMGAEDGSHAAHNAVSAGLLAGTTVWLDLEGINGNATETAAYANAWNDALRAAGYDTGVYVGGGCPLDEQQLYSLLHTHRYWRSFSQVPNVAGRGYCMIQLYPTTNIAGVNVDLDIIQQDYKRGLPRWLVSSHAAATLASTLPPDPVEDTNPDGTPIGGAAGGGEVPQ
jgi:hypothetical protein